MSRVDAVKAAIMKARRRLRGSVAASDAFFPFRDGLDAIAAAGATAIVQPGGSVKDAEVIAAADEHGLAMVFTRPEAFQALMVEAWRRGGPAVRSLGSPARVQGLGSNGPATSRSSISTVQTIAGNAGTAASSRVERSPQARPGTESDDGAGGANHERCRESIALGPAAREAQQQRHEHGVDQHEGQAPSFRRSADRRQPEPPGSEHQRETPGRGVKDQPEE